MKLQWPKALYPLATLACVSLSAFVCTASSTKELLDADFLGSGKTIRLLTPASGEVVTSRPALVWTTTAGLSKFRLQVSTDRAFSKLVVDKSIQGTSFTIGPADTISGAALDATTHYWRVSLKDGSNSSSTSAMEVVQTQALYVNAGNASANPVGSKTNPFRSIAAAMSFADGQRNGDAATAVEIFVAQGTYAERVALLPGITLRGGYNPSSWTRTSPGNTSLIQSPTTEAIYAGANIAATYRSTTVVDGFTITPTPNVDNDTAAVIIENSSPTFQGNTITGNGSANTFRSYGILIGGASNPAITQNTITGGGVTGVNTSVGILQSSTNTVTISANTIATGVGVTASGIVASGSASIIAGNSISGGSAGSSTTHGVRASGGTATISSNTITGGTGTLTVRGLTLDTGATATITGNSIIGGAGTTSTRGILLTSASASTATIYDNSIQGGFNSSGPVAIEVPNGNTAYLYRNNIYGGSILGAGAAIGIQVGSATVDIFNNLIHAGLALSTGVAYGVYVGPGSAAPAQLRIFNNTINGGAAGIGCGSCVAAAIFISNSTGAFSAFEIRNNILFTSGGNSRYGIYEFNAAAIDPTSVANNDIFDTPTALYRDGETALAMTSLCGTGNFGNGGCGTVLATPVASGNISVNNTGGQLFQNHWRSTDVTTAGGSTTTLTVASCASYLTAEHLEYNLDGIARQISGCAVGIVTFTPALSSAAATQRTVMLWGPSANTSPKYSLQPAAPAICNTLYGGLNLGALATSDYALASRTASLAGLPCTLTAPSNTTGAGWSMGAYERDN